MTLAIKVGCMSLRDWINKLKSSGNGGTFAQKWSQMRTRAASMTRSGMTRLSPMAQGVKERLGPPLARFGAASWGALKGAGHKIKETSLKSDSIRALVEKANDGLANRWRSFKEALPKNFPRTMEDLRQVSPQELADAFSGVLKQGNLATYFRLGAVAVAAYFLADTAALFSGALIPEPPPVPAPTVRAKAERKKTLEDFGPIISRNIFNSRGIIPDDMIQADPNGPARKSNLPLNLIGTVVLADERKSIAAIEDKSASQIAPARIGDVVGGKANIKRIEHLKVIFVNTATGMLEYIEIPEDQLTRIDTRPSAVSKEAPIQKEGETHFNVQKVELDKAFGNLNQILREARAIPNFENGVPNGYKIIQIVPNSIYTKLGIKEGEILQAVNGEPINDPGKAFQLLNELRSGSGHVEITVKSTDGKARKQTYDIR